MVDERTRWPRLEPDAVAWSWRDPSRALPPRPQAVRIATCNLAHGRGTAVHQVFQAASRIRANLNAVAAILRRRDVHVVALQEADGRNWWSGGFDHVRYLARSWGAAYAVRGSHVERFGLDYGTALISCLPLDAPRAAHFVGPRYRPGKGLCSATVQAWPQQDLAVHAVHLDFLSVAHRRRQLEQIATYLDDRDIVAGDFNATWRDRDGSLADFCTRHELRTWQPERRDLVTFPGRLRRLDWIFATRALTITDHRIERRRVSDHRLVVAEVAGPLPEV